MPWKEIKVVSAWFYDLDAAFLYPAIAVLIAGAGELGNFVGRRFRKTRTEGSDIGTLTGASLGLLALLLAFSFSIALSRYDARRDMVLEEANAIGSTANFALMLPEASQEPILILLRAYTAVRIGLGVPFDPPKMERDVARSLALQSQLWQHAVAITQAAPQSLPAYRFVASLNEMNNIHERRLTVLRNHVPRGSDAHVDRCQHGGDGVHRLPRGCRGRPSAYYQPDHVRHGRSADYARC